MKQRKTNSNYFLPRLCSLLFHLLLLSALRVSVVITIQFNS
jgi:hypothetical protein